MVEGPAACACGLCVAPRLRLPTNLRVHIFTSGREKADTSWRFRHLLDQGLAAHPRVDIVGREADADVVLWLPQWTNRIPMIKEPRRRLIILDEHDDRARRDGGYGSDAYLAYYKRSFVRKTDGAFEGLFEAPLGARTYALPYSISDAYLSSDASGGRPLDIVCTLRVGQGVYPARARVLACVEIKILRRVRAESSRRPPRHRRDACSMAWRCRFLTARPSQDGRVVAEK